MPDYTITSMPDSAPDNIVLTISGSITIPFIGDIAKELTPHLTGANDVRLLLDGVTDIDVTGLQLLCAIHRQHAAASKSCTLSCTLSDAVYTAAAEAGFLRHAGCIISETCPCIWAGGEES